MRSRLLMVEGLLAVAVILLFVASQYSEEKDRFRQIQTVPQRLPSNGERATEIEQSHKRRRFLETPTQLDGWDGIDAEGGLVSKLGDEDERMLRPKSYKRRSSPKRRYRQSKRRRRSRPKSRKSSKSTKSEKSKKSEKRSSKASFRDETSEEDDAEITLPPEEPDPLSPSSEEDEDEITLPPVVPRSPREVTSAPGITLAPGTILIRRRRAAEGAYGHASHGRHAHHAYHDDGDNGWGEDEEYYEDEYDDYDDEDEEYYEAEDLEDVSYEDYKDYKEDSFRNFNKDRQEELSLNINEKASDTANGKEKHTLVVYSAPTSLDLQEGKTWLYHKNFRYFLEHGIECESQDTVIVTTAAVATHYYREIKVIQMACFSKPFSVKILEREDKCYDMESLRVVLEQVELSFYDYFVYLNCGVVGPKSPTLGTKPWPQEYTSRLSDKVKMTGLSTNCVVHPHVQSMLFALDKVGLEIIKSSGAVYDCGKRNSEMSPEDKVEIIANYEIGMGKAIIGAGYYIGSTLGAMGPVSIGPSDLKRDLKWCEDIWHPNGFRLMGHGSMPRWADFTFFKSSREYMLADVYNEMKYGHTESFYVVENEQSDSAPVTHDRLWVGDVETVVDAHSLELSLVITYCSHSLDWLADYAKGYTFKAVTVVSKCGKPVPMGQLPEGSIEVPMPNVGRNDHTIAHWMSSMDTSFAKDNDVVVFLKDNLDIHQTSTSRTLEQILRITSAAGFGCFQEPRGGLSQFHRTDVLSTMNMTSYERNSHGASPEAPKHTFKSRYSNMGNWLEDMKATLPTPLTSVCYGGNFAAKTQRISSVPNQVWKNFEKSLSRDDNIEEGHFAERSWAGLLSKPLEKVEIEDLARQAASINRVVAGDGGGHLGALYDHN